MVQGSGGLTLTSPSGYQMPSLIYFVPHTVHCEKPAFKNKKKIYNYYYYFLFLFFLLKISKLICQQNKKIRLVKTFKNKKKNI